MLFSDISIIDSNFAVRDHMYVGLRGNSISYVSDTEPEEDFGSVYKGKGKLLVPAFFNAHAHNAMTLLRGYGGGLNLQHWLENKIFPFEAKLTEEDVYSGTLLAMAESIRFGAVCSTDMYFFPDAIARAVADSGAKANISNAITCFDDRSLEELPVYRVVLDSIKNWHGAEDGKIRIDISLHAEYTSTEKIAREVAELARNEGLRLHIHAAETERESEECLARRGMSPIEYLKYCGLLDMPATLAHCVWVSEEDMDTIKESGATVATCPVSNMKLASGFADIPLMLSKGINVALGTDGASSNNSLNMLSDIKTLALANKCLRRDPSILPASELICMISRAGALSQGRDDCGLIAEGFKADLAVINMDLPNMQPLHDPLENLLFSSSGGEVCLTVCDGKELYRDGEFKTIDVERAEYEVRSCTERILGEL